MPNSWVVRSGRHGERDQWALANGVSGGGWQEVPDLTQCGSREAVASVLAKAFADISDNTLANYTGQMWALRGRIAVGDLLAMPLKTTQRIALGRVVSGYHYIADEPDPNRRHVVGVDWKVTDLPRTSVKQDLLYTLGSALSIFAPSKNYAVERLEKLLELGIDPGQVPYMAPTKLAGISELKQVSEDDVDEPELHADIVEVARDQITARIEENFAGHELAYLVAEILAAEGFVCSTSAPGPDGGIDILAGKGALGMDAPTIVVQVKSGSHVSDPVVQQLHGAMSTQRADQGLLVAWGGLTKPARHALRDHQLRIRVWEAADIVQAVLRNYDRLSADVQTRLPLKRVWMLAD